eukprot:m.394690 g.394690  ORF g.394690 m.394690 type:complete len:70 (+) comp16767_c0_seq24:208-417(+)
MIIISVLFITIVFNAVAVQTTATAGQPQLTTGAETTFTGANFVFNSLIYILPTGWDVLTPTGISISTES